MVDTSNPTFADVRWGERNHCYFDYWQNPTRVDGGNPLLMFHHAGINTQSFRAARSSADEANFYFLQWLLGNDTSTEPSEHWDVCSISTGAQKHDTSVFQRSVQYFTPHTIFDTQLCIASIKAMHATYGFNPKKVHGMGYSNGAIKLGLSQLWAPMTGAGGGKTQVNGRAWNGTHDSTLRSVILDSPVVDMQSYGGVDRFHYSILAPMFGCDDSSSTEWDAIPQKFKAANSILQFFVDRNLAHYPGFYVTFVEGGDHIYPLGYSGRSGSDPHDSIQYTNLVTAMENAGVDFGKQLLSSSSLKTNTGHAGGTTSAAALRVFRERAQWLSVQNATP